MFIYFKPNTGGPAYRIELKKSLADDDSRLKKMLATIKQQGAFPDILEPFPQYLADMMAKSVSGGLYCYAGCNPFIRRAFFEQAATCPAVSV